jgi:hypothetical protein
MMSASGDGILLGLGNTCVVAVGLALSMHEPVAQVVPAVLMIGFIPAAIIGMITGWLAGAVTNRARWTRLLVIAPLPLGFVLLAGAICDIPSYANGACIPTMVCVLMLERSTRSSQDTVPRATIASKP